VVGRQVPAHAAGRVGEPSGDPPTHLGLACALVHTPCLACPWLTFISKVTSKLPSAWNRMLMPVNGGSVAVTGAGFAGAGVEGDCTPVGTAGVVSVTVGFVGDCPGVFCPGAVPGEAAVAGTSVLCLAMACCSSPNASDTTQTSARKTDRVSIAETSLKVDGTTPPRITVMANHRNMAGPAVINQMAYAVGFDRFFRHGEFPTERTEPIMKVFPRTNREPSLGNQPTSALPAPPMVTPLQ